MPSITHTTLESTPLKNNTDHNSMNLKKTLILIGFRNVRLHHNPLSKKENEKKD